MMDKAQAMTVKSNMLLPFPRDDEALRLQKRLLSKDNAYLWSLLYPYP
jgi:hypothetical protein